MRLSPTLFCVLAAGIAAATAAVWTALSPWFGAARAVPPALAILAACGLSVVAWCRRQPTALEIGPDSFVTYSRAGARLFQGRLMGASQWGSALLALSVQGEAGRATVLVAADAVGRAAFRELAVRARCAAGR
ncbi:protein YgfX [Paraburkholderia acidipaludis]|uniref:protein YgfX n=1 Tax=Paraburkholderia acidipaludis TaxID=660537 RepID=UPI0012EC57D5|nr:protein YgfX [Paraburkholderia acidipaludis]